MISPSPITLSMARDLCLKLVEIKSLTAANLTESMIILIQAGREIVAQGQKYPGLPLLRLAGSVTSLQIEKVRLGTTDSVVKHLRQNAGLYCQAAAALPMDKVKIIIPLVHPLILKLLETNSLSFHNLGPFLQEICASLGQLGL
jgi:hypothetical protein